MNERDFNRHRSDGQTDRRTDGQTDIDQSTPAVIRTDNYIKENKVSYRITNMNINILTEADPNMAFYISPDDKVKESPKFDIALNDDGIIKSIGLEDINSDYQ
mgnify:CR=1 FL=1